MRLRSAMTLVNSSGVKAVVLIIRSTPACRAQNRVLGSHAKSQSATYNFMTQEEFFKQYAGGGAGRWRAMLDRPVYGGAIAGLKFLSYLFETSMLFA
jgi:hypothetical protein